jgi:hypothetical protein
VSLSRGTVGATLPRSAWALRIVLAVLAVIAGYIACTHSLATVLRAKAPDQAYRIAPWHARVAAQYSALKLGNGTDSADRAAAASLASLALLHDPTAVPAVVTLGLSADIDKNPSRARALFAYSDRISRRDLNTRLWLIEDAVRRERIDEALGHYDTALRTSRTAVAILYPILATASTDPAIARALAGKLAKNPPWAEGFVGYLAGNTPDPVATAALFRTLSSQIAVAESASAAVIQALVRDRKFDEAWRYFLSIRPDTPRNQSRDPKFGANIVYPTVFDWVTVTGDRGVSATVARSDRHGMIDFSAPATAGGAAVQQLLLLQPGAYQLRGHSIGVEQSDRARPYWTLVCADGRELGRVDIPNSSSADGRFAGQFTVPSACSAQYLRLVVRPSNAVGGVAGQIDYVVLAPIDRDPVR